MPEAARVGDQVKHSSALLGLMAGIVVGAIVAVAIVGTGGAALAIGAAVCTGVSIGGSLGKMIGKHIPGFDCGPIMMGVPTVVVGGMVAAVVGGNVSCTGPPLMGPHPGIMIAQGSSNVFIGNMPAARKGDKTACGATIGYGSDTVIIGGVQVTYMEIQPEIPAWVDYGLMALGLLGGYGLLRGAGFTLAGTLARLGGATAGSFAGGWGGGKLAEALGYKSNSWGHDLISLVGASAGGWVGYKGGARSTPGRYITRTDSNPYSSQGKTPDRLKSSIDSDGNLNPANANGKASIKDHVRGSEPKKSDSPYTSFSEKDGTPKNYGNKKVVLDKEALQRDIKNGKVKDVEVIEHEQVKNALSEDVSKAQSRYNENPSAKNLKKLNDAKRDLANANRDKEILVKGKVPAKYIQVK